MRVMLDTNILLSAGLFYKSKLSTLTVIISNEFKIVLSSQIVEELRMVTARKFPGKKKILENFLRRLNFEMAFTPNEIDPDIYPKIRDKNDYPILASAIIAEVDVFVTGDKDFSVLDLDNPEIMTIREFADKYLE
jgi:putative PIN family toxin of toxin-antitoxin system